VSAGVADDPHIVRTGGLDWTKVWRGRHPFNPASEMRIVRLGGEAGLTRIGVNLVRVPPGKESFIPHAHTLQEEFAFVLEGRGEVLLDGVRHPIGPGDFVGFPTDGVVHSIACAGPEDLLYLTGGESGPVELSDFPTLGRTMVMRQGKMTLFGEDGVETLTQAEWMARTRLPEDEA
jgi:uncharacterized cupin superfamily protein